MSFEQFCSLHDFYGRLAYGARLGVTKVVDNCYRGKVSKNKLRTRHA